MEKGCKEGVSLTGTNDNVADILMYDDTDGSDGNFENIFYRDFRDLNYSSLLDSYYCSILSLNIKANING